MGRKKLIMTKIENSTARQVTFSKRKDGIVKKANELGVLCGIDVALIMFSPSGRLTTFASTERVEDVFIRLMERPDGIRGPASSNELLIQKLRKLKFEAEMMEKMEIIEVLEENLKKLNQRHYYVNEKMKYYKPNVEHINSVREVEVYLQFLEYAMHRVRSAKVKFLEKEVDLQNLQTEEIHYPQVAAITEDGESSTGNQSVHFPQNRIILMEEPHEMAGLPSGPNRSLSFRRAPKEPFNGMF